MACNSELPITDHASDELQHFFGPDVNCLLGGNELIKLCEMLERHQLTVLLPLTAVPRLLVATPHCSKMS
jgi:hypothetical protein